MSPTINVLGIEIPRAGAPFYTVLAVHVPAGLAAVVAGAIAASSRKGSRRHVRFGRFYFWALCVVFATSTLLGVMRLGEDYHLVLIGSVAFSAACLGHFTRARHRPGHAPHILGMSTSYVAMLVAFYVDNGPQLPLWNRLPHFAYWLLPIVIGAPLTWRALRGARAAT